MDVPKLLKDANEFEEQAARAFTRGELILTIEGLSGALKRYLMALIRSYGGTLPPTASWNDLSKCRLGTSRMDLEQLVYRSKNVRDHYIAVASMKPSRLVYQRYDDTARLKHIDSLKRVIKWAFKQLHSRK